MHPLAGLVRRPEAGGRRALERDRLRQGYVDDPAQKIQNAKPHTLPLTPLMLSIIELVPRRDGLDHLFGAQQARVHDVMGRQQAPARREARLETALDGTHDIRRQVATLSAIGVEPHIVEEVSATTADTVAA